MALGANPKVLEGGRGPRTDEDGRPVTLPVDALGDTATVSGSVTSAGAAATLAQLTGLTSNATYDVEVGITLTGTAETALRNIELRKGSTQIAILPSLSGAGQHRYRFRVTLGGADTTIDLRSIAAAVVGSIYTVSIVAKRVVAS